MCGAVRTPDSSDFWETRRADSEGWEKPIGQGTHSTRVARVHASDCQQCAAKQCLMSTHNPHARFGASAAFLARILHFLGQPKAFRYLG
jgi:hypothetical protein